MTFPRTYLCQWHEHLWQDRNLQVCPERWNAVAWSEDFEDILGEAGPRPRHETRFKMAYCAHGISVLAWMQGREIWATQTERDSVIFRDNDFELFLDPDGDGALYLELEINALNTVWDLVLVKSYRNGGPPLDSFDIKGLQSAVLIEGELNMDSLLNRGWWAQIQIPYQSLREIAGSMNFPPLPGDEWRINFSRVHWDAEARDGRFAKIEGRAEHNWVWSPMGEVDMHLPERWGLLRFE